MATTETEEPKRPYGLGKRLEQMDQTRVAILHAARAQLEANGYRQLTMASLAAEAGVTRQTVHNLFGTKAAILEALFDTIALDGGMNRMAEVMTQPTPEGMLERFVEVFCHFWASHRVLLRRIHGIGAIDLEFASVLSDRNLRRLMAARRIVRLSGIGPEAELPAATLAALTSFEFYDVLAGSLDESEAAAVILGLARDHLAGVRQGNARRRQRPAGAR